MGSTLETRIIEKSAPDQFALESSTITKNVENSDADKFVLHIRKVGVDKLADQGRAIKLRQKIEEFTLFDDELMSWVFDENIECMELVLRIILKRTDIRGTQVHTQ